MKYCASLVISLSGRSSEHKRTVRRDAEYVEEALLSTWTHPTLVGGGRPNVGMQQPKHSMGTARWDGNCEMGPPLASNRRRQQISEPRLKAAEDMGVLLVTWTPILSTIQNYEAGYTLGLVFLSNEKPSSFLSKDFSLPSE